jgi:Tfp pilus assembly protein PilF
VWLAYVNTLSLQYALDDRLVIYQNNFTLEGFDGVKDVLTRDGFAGYFVGDSNLVAGGRYRPLAQLTFITEYELFGQSIRDSVGLNHAEQNETLFNQTSLPLVSHGVNVLLYTLLCIIILLVLQQLFKDHEDTKWYLSLSFMTTVLFAVHPLHTEVVANIKGRDEILSMLGGMSTLWCVLKSKSTGREQRPIANYGYLLLSFFTMFAGLLSKENAITFVALIPLVLYYSIKNNKDSFRKIDYLWTLLPSIFASLFFLYLRYQALGGFMNEDLSGSILNNPYINSSLSERIATTIFTWALYLKLLVFPYPLTHDYYPYHVAYTTFANPVVLIMIVLLLFLLIYTVKKIGSRDIFSFAILFFFITFSVVSNLLFNVGTFMNERFLFAPLLGFTLILSAGIKCLHEHVKSKTWLTILFLVIVLLYTGETVWRNRAWANDFTLFTTDVKTSPNSIKCNVSAGGSYVQKYKKSKEKAKLDKTSPSNKGERDAHLAEKYLLKALSLDKYAFHAHQLLGELYFSRAQYDLSEQYYKNAVAIQPWDMEMQRNLEAVRLARSKSLFDDADEQLKAGNAREALLLINQYIAINPNSAPAYNLKGKIWGMGLQRIDSALVNLDKALSLDPDLVAALENSGVAHAIAGHREQALKYLNAAYSRNPKNPSVIHNIATLYKEAGNMKAYKEWSEKSIE